MALEVQITKPEQDTRGRERRARLTAEKRKQDAVVITVAVVAVLRRCAVAVASRRDLVFPSRRQLLRLPRIGSVPE